MISLLVAFAWLFIGVVTLRFQSKYGKILVTFSHNGFEYAAVLLLFLLIILWPVKHWVTLGFVTFLEREK